MQILNELQSLKGLPSPVALTIGNFDGVHLGHQYLLQKLKEVSKTSVVLTFKTHPATVLHPDTPLSQLYSNEHKVKILDHLGIDVTLNIPFTKSLSELSPEAFLEKLFPFDLLLLGYDSAFGHQKAGTEERIASHAKKMGYRVSYLEPVLFDNKPISSSRIRAALQAGDLKLAEALLGRKFSLFGPVISGRGEGKTLGFSTANLSTSGLTLPPLGVYAVRSIVGIKSYPAVANLGFAPTLRTSSEVLLEVHLLDESIDLRNSSVEVIFEQFLRPEQKFSSKEALIQQIQDDIIAAKKILF